MGKSKRSTFATVRNRKKPDTDWFSMLPDDILIDIISRLNVKEAARTSVLSTRWKYLWIYTSNLNFYPLRKLRPRIGMGSREEKYMARSEYISCVDKVLASHRNPNINEFGIYYQLYECHGSNITNWIHKALSKNVQKLVLNLGGVCGKKQFTFPQDFYNSLRSPPCLSSLMSLKSLCLADVKLSSEVLEFFIYNCPLLERLSVTNVDSPHLVALKVVGSSIRLKYLELYCCFSLEEVEISALSILSFKYYGGEIKLTMENVPQLIDATIGGYSETPLRNLIEPIMKYLPQLQSLELHMHLYEDNTQFPFCELPKLRHLTFKVFAPDCKSLVGLTCMIKACPILQKFTLLFVHTGYSRARKICQFPECPHQHLKVVEFVGFVGHPIDLELAFYLLENATVLKKMIINPASPYTLGSVSEFEDSNEKAAARVRARQLEEKVPQGVEFIIR